MQRTLESVSGWLKKLLIVRRSRKRFNCDIAYMPFSFCELGEASQTWNLPTGMFPVTCLWAHRSYLFWLLSSMLIMFVKEIHLFSYIFVHLSRQKGGHRMPYDIIFSYAAIIFFSFSQIIHRNIDIANYNIIMTT